MGTTPWLSGRISYDWMQLDTYGFHSQKNALLVHGSELETMYPSTCGIKNEGEAMRGALHMSHVSPINEVSIRYYYLPSRDQNKKADTRDP